MTKSVRIEVAWPDASIGGNARYGSDFSTMQRTDVQERASGCGRVVAKVAAVMETGQ